MQDLEPGDCKQKEIFQLLGQLKEAELAEISCDIVIGKVKIKLSEIMNLRKGQLLELIFSQTQEVEVQIEGAQVAKGVLVGDGKEIWVEILD